MPDQLQFTQELFPVQSELAEWLKIIIPLYRQYVTKTIQHRRNVQCPAG